GRFDCTLDSLRLLAFTDLLQGRNPLDRITCAPSADQPGPSGDQPAERQTGDSRPAPLPALVNLLIPAGTLLGWSSAPAQTGSWGLLDRDEARQAAAAAAEHPRTRWCVTVVGPDGTARAHGCARGQHPRLLDDLEPQPPPGQPAELLRRLGLTLTPVASGDCDHAEAETRYSPSRRLKHVVRARTATCDAPGCDSPAVITDLDHTVPWPAGPTDQCNLAPRCRTHHRAKQAPDWKVEQLAPGVSRWTMPSGRRHVTRPTRYDT
ncbi:MAG TPA: HNH endonuclease signature motif containing protein, partial [Trebonia sp.]|nr:HNH endonuclease signature motif containing protein [Trebonia sp.]